LLTNLQKLQLRSCNDLRNLPDMPHLKILIVECCNEVTTIPKFPSLVELVVRSCSWLDSVGYCPNLKVAEFDDCGSLKLWSCGDLNSVHVAGRCYHHLGGFIMLSDVAFLSLANLNAIHIKGIGGDKDNYLISRKSRTLSNCVDLKDYSCCENIYQLELFQLNLRFCHGIKNIHHLKIKNCSFLTTTSGLLNISGSLLVEHCSAMMSLQDLKNIPVVEIHSDNQEITDFSGLGNHENLIAKGRCWESFVRFKRNNPVCFASINEFIIKR
jgi:hypothetical protein